MKKLLLVAPMLIIIFISPSVTFSSGGISPGQPSPSGGKWKKSTASFYGKGKFRGYCGDSFVSQKELVVAHKNIPCGTSIYFKRGKKVFRARVVDRGPHYPGREFDLSWALARKLNILSKGAGPVFWRR